MSSEGPAESSSLSDYEQAAARREADASKRMRIGITAVVLSSLFALLSIVVFVIFLRAGVGVASLLILAGLWVVPSFTLPGIRLIRDPYTNI